jgi:hypothetical protein
MSALDFFQFLTPGSVWVRPDTNRRVKFLFLTNEKLSPKLQLKNPSQVVYVDENGDIFNRSIDVFRAQYQFNHVDGELEKRLSGLFVFDLDDVMSVEDSDDEDIEVGDEQEDDSLTEIDTSVDVRHPIEVAASTLEPVILVAEPVTTTIAEVGKPATLAEAMARDLMAPEKVARPAFEVGFAISVERELSTPTLTVAELSDAVVRYAREASLNVEGQTLHKLTFALDDRVTLDTLIEIFHPESPSNTVDAFNVSTGSTNETFFYEGYLGVFPDFTTDRLCATVIVSTNEGREPDEQDDAPLVTPEAVQVFSAPMPDIGNLADLVQSFQTADLTAATIAPAPALSEEAAATIVPTPETVTSFDTGGHVTLTLEDVQRATQSNVVAVDPVATIPQNGTLESTPAPAPVVEAAPAQLVEPQPIPVQVQIVTPIVVAVQ